MKLPIFNLQKSKVGERELPSQFNEEYRPDLIKRAVQALQSAARQVYGGKKDAGMRHSTYVSKRRREYRGCYGHGISRVARKILSRSGIRMFWVGAKTPQTVGGRRSHAPKPEKNRIKEINIKENRKAIRSAIAATVIRNVVEERGHHLPKEYPFIVESSIEKISKTKEIGKVLKVLGFEEELKRTSKRKVRAGRGKTRGRKYQVKKGILIVVSEDCPLKKSARNILGLEITTPKALNAEILAPGSKPGRITLWTEKAIEAFSKEKLFN